MIAMDRQLLTVEEVAQRLQLSEGTVKRLLRDGELEGYKIRGTWRIAQSNLEQFLERRSNRRNQNKPAE